MKITRHSIPAREHVQFDYTGVDDLPLLEGAIAKVTVADNSPALEVRNAALAAGAIHVTPIQYQRLRPLATEAVVISAVQTPLEVLREMAATAPEGWEALLAEVIS